MVTMIQILFFFFVLSLGNSMCILHLHLSTKFSADISDLYLDLQNLELKSRFTYLGCSI